MCAYRDCSAAGAGAKRSLARPPPRGGLVTSAILSVRRATAVYTISTFWQRRRHRVHELNRRSHDARRTISWITQRVVPPSLLFPPPLYSLSSLTLFVGPWFGRGTHLERITNGFLLVEKDASLSPSVGFREFTFPRPLVAPLRFRSDAVSSPWCVRRRRRGGGRSVVTRSTLSPAVSALRSRVTPSTRSVHCGDAADDEILRTTILPRVSMVMLLTLSLALVTKRNEYWLRATLLNFWFRDFSEASQCRFFGRFLRTSSLLFHCSVTRINSTLFANRSERSSEVRLPPKTRGVESNRS